MIFKNYNSGERTTKKIWFLKTIILYNAKPENLNF